MFTVGKPVDVAEIYFIVDLFHYGVGFPQHCAKLFLVVCCNILFGKTFVIVRFSSNKVTWIIYSVDMREKLGEFNDQTLILEIRQSSVNPILICGIIIADSLADIA